MGDSANKSSKKRNRMWNSSGRSNKRSSGHQSHHRSRIDEGAAEKLFQEFADEDDPTVAGMEGISKLCDQLDLDPLEDIRILVLLWKLGSKEKPAQISKDEWMAGCNKLELDSIDKFKELLPSLDTGFLDQMEFKDFHKVRSTFDGCWIRYKRTGLGRDAYGCLKNSSIVLLLIFFLPSFVFNSTDKGRIEPWTRKW